VRARLIGWCAALALVLASGAVEAEESRALVQVVIAATPDVEARLSPVLTELLGRLPVALELKREATIEVARVLTPPESPPPALARVFIDVTGRDVAIVYLVDAAWQRLLVRRLPLEHGLDEVAREQVAHVVESAIQSLAAGGVLGVTRAEASAELGVVEPSRVTAPRDERRTAPVPTRALAPPAPKSPPPRVNAWDARVGVGWGLAPWTPQTLLQGPELRVRLGWGRGRLSWGGGVSGRYLLEREVRSALAGMVIEGVGVRALGHARYALEPGFAVLASLGLGFDRETFRPLPGDASTVLLGAGGARTSGIVATSLGMEARIAGPIWLGADAGVELEVAPDDYVVGRGSGFVAIAEPLRLRPNFSAQLGFAL
jgi:hypothetical protein